MLNIKQKVNRNSILHAKLAWLLVFAIIFSLLTLSAYRLTHAQTTTGGAQSEQQSQSGSDQPANTDDTQKSDYQKYLEGLTKDPGDGKRRFSARGVFNCEGAGYAPVGLPGPSGPFVPVFDEATHSQIQLLTYKECVLDKIASHNANAVLAGITSSFIKTVNDEDLIVRDYVDYLKKEADIPAIKEFSKKCREKLGSDSDICAQIVSGKLKDVQDKYNRLKCEVKKEDVEIFKKGDPEHKLPLKTRLKILSSSACLPFDKYLQAKMVLDEELHEYRLRAAYEAQDGFKPVKHKITRKELDLDNSRPGALVYKDVTKNEVVTPGVIVSGQLNLVLGTGIRKVESADEIDEMVQTFLANLSNRALDTSNYGVYGMSRDLNNNGASFLSSLAQQENAVARQFRAFAGGLTLGAMIDNEQKFKKYKEQIAKGIINSIHDLRHYENICFEDKILKGAKEAVASTTKQAACDLWQSQTTATGTCPISVTVSSEILPNYLDIKEKQEGNTVSHGDFIISGKSQSGSGTLSFINDDNKATSTPVSLSDNWSTEIKASQIPEGNLTVKLEHSGSDNIENAMYKKTIAGIPVVVLPDKRYDIKLTAKSTGGRSAQSTTITLHKTRTHSNAYNGVSGSLTSTLKEILKDIQSADDTLKILYKIASEAQGNPEIANYKVDQLVSHKAIVTASDVRKAKQDAENSNYQMQKFTQGVVQDEWEASGAGWCNKDKWEEFKAE